MTKCACSRWKHGAMTVLMAAASAAEHTALKTALYMHNNHTKHNDVMTIRRCLSFAVGDQK